MYVFSLDKLVERPTVIAGVGAADDWWDTAGSSGDGERVGEALGDGVDRDSSRKRNRPSGLEREAVGVGAWTRDHKRIEVQAELHRILSAHYHLLTN